MRFVRVSMISRLLILSILVSGAAIANPLTDAQIKELIVDSNSYIDNPSRAAKACHRPSAVSVSWHFFANMYYISVIEDHSVIGRSARFEGRS